MNFRYYLERKEDFMKITLYANKHCPDCPPVIEKLKANNIDFRLVELTESMDNLREFLKLRDEESFFDDAKKNDRVGVPTIMLGDREKFIDAEDGFEIEDLR